MISLSSCSRARALSNSSSSPLRGLEARDSASRPNSPFTRGALVSIHSRGEQRTRLAGALWRELESFN